MTGIAKNVLKDALKLRPVERAELIERLFRSFDRSKDHHIDSTWSAEMESRIDAYDKGKIDASPAEDVIARINRR